MNFMFIRMKNDYCVFVGFRVGRREVLFGEAGQHRLPGLGTACDQACGSDLNGTNPQEKMVWRKDVVAK